MNKKIIATVCACAIVLSAAGCSKTQSSDSKKLAEAEKKIEALEKRVDELSENIENADYDDYDFDEEVHEIYDDTAVVEAYKSGDDSNLTDEKDKYIYEELKKAVDEIITDDMTDYQKEEAVYTYMCTATEFDSGTLSAIDSTEDYSHTPYGFFHDHSTICVGNATTFKLFMDVLGIECDIIHSTESGEHAWNIVQIDGEWYHVDITFDGGEGEPDYSRLNVTDEVKVLDGYPWNPEDFHECTSTKYNYGVQHAVECEDVYAIPAALKDAFDAKATIVYLKVPVPDDADADVFSIQLLAIANMAESDRYMCYGTNPIVADDGKSVVIGFSIYSYDSSDGEVYPEISGNRADIDYAKISSAYDEAFGGEVTISSDPEEYRLYENSYISEYNEEVEDYDYSEEADG